MDYRILVLASLFVGLSVAPPPSTPVEAPPTSGDSLPALPSPAVDPQAPIGPSGGEPPSSGGVDASGQPIPQPEQQIPAEGQNPELPDPEADPTDQNPFDPQDGSDTQQPPQSPPSDPQQNQAYQAYLQQQAFLQAYIQQQALLQQQAFLQQQAYLLHHAQKPFGMQSSPVSFSGTIPGYGAYAHASTGGMDYLQSMFHHMPMIISDPHDLSPFSSGYGGMQMGMGSYGMPQMYGGQAYPQGPQGYPSSGQPQPQSSQGLMNSNPQGLMAPNAGLMASNGQGPMMPNGQGPMLSNGQGSMLPNGQAPMMPNSPGAQMYYPTSPLTSQTNKKKLPQNQINGKIQYAS